MRGVIVAFSIACAGTALVAGVRLVDPAGDLVRVRVLLTTSAWHADLTLLTGTVATTRANLVSELPLYGAWFDGRTCHVDNRSSTEIEVECQFLVTALSPTVPVDWTVTLSEPTDVVVEVFNANDARRPSLVDRVAGRGETIRFSTPVTLLLQGGPVDIGSVGAPRVLAFYYPWYFNSTWSDPLFQDHPLRRYSTDQELDVLAEFREARRAGLDGLVMSWNGVNRPLRLALSAARQTGLVVSTLIETKAATRTRQGRNVIDPNVIADWIAEITDKYHADSAYLKVAERPVIFVYAADLIEPAVWRAIMGSVRSGGRNPLVLAETTDVAWLDALDGQFLYATAGLSASDIGPFNLAQSLCVRAHHLLLPSSDPRRAWAATVTPGYDDTLLTTRASTFKVDRAGGAFYDAQWRAAIAAQPDWVLVTSWNEWYENTHIEASERYGDAYVRRTAYWAHRFRCESRSRPPRPSTLPDGPCENDSGSPTSK